MVSLNRIIALILFFFFIHDVAQASGQLQLQTGLERYQTGAYLEYYTDTSDLLTINDIHTVEYSSKFTLNRQTPLNLGINKHQNWIRFKLKNTSTISNWMMEIKYPTLNDVVIYVLNNQGKIDTIINAGINQIYEESKNNSYSIYDNLNFKTDENYTIYIRIITDSYIIVPIYIYSIPEFVIHDRKQNSIYFILYGIILAIIMFNMMLFFLTREFNYLIFSIYMFVLSINANYLYGYGLNFLHHLSPFYLLRMRQILFGSGSLVFMLFSIYYLELKKYKNILLIYRLLILLSTVFVLSLFIKHVPYRLFTLISPILFLGGTIIAFLSGIFVYTKGQKTALYYIISFSAVMVSSILYFLTLNSIIPYTEFGFYINTYASVFFGMMLSIGLTEKVTAIHQEKLKRINVENLNTNLQNEIKERTKIENQLRESEERFRLLFELDPLAIALTEMETGEIIDVNHKMELMSGYTKEELLGQNSIDLKIITAEVRFDLISEIKIYEQIHGKQVSFYPKNGLMLRCLFFCRKINIQGKDILISIFADHTSFLQQQEKINLLNTAISQSANSIFITNLDGKIEFVNDSLLQITGYTEEELIGEKPSIFKSNLFTTDFYMNLWETILGGEQWIGEFYNRRKNGEYFWDSTTITPVRNEEGELIRFIAIKQDITEIKFHQQELVDSEKRLKVLNSTKDKFFSIIGHDLMNPFNALLGFSDLLMESIQLKNWDDSLAYTKIIDQSSRRISETLQKILLWARTQSGKISVNRMPVNSLEVIMGAVNVVRNIGLTKNIKIDIELEKDELIELDQNMINSVLMNLLHNAIKFSQPNSSVLIKVTNHENYSLFCIRDFGIGMNEAQINDLFNLERSSSSAGTNGEIGTGLGLIICKDFVNAHQGKIWAESSINQGSSFYFTIPHSI